MPAATRIPVRNAQRFFGPPAEAEQRPDPADDEDGWAISDFTSVRLEVGDLFAYQSTRRAVDGVIYRALVLGRSRDDAMKRYLEARAAFKDYAGGDCEEEDSLFARLDAAKGEIQRLDSILSLLETARV